MICIAWWGFPQYAARCVGAFVSAVAEKVCVVATRPSVPVEGMERRCKCRVVWIEPDDDRPLSLLLGEIPRVIVVSGWSIPAFNRHVLEVKCNGGRAIAMVDNNFVPSFKEWIRAFRFRLFLKRRYAGYFVPGKSGTRLLRFYGASPREIALGLYSADEKLFTDGKPLVERPKRIVYVGQFIERKNVRRLLDAFKEAEDKSSGGWELHLYGSGPLGELLRARGDERIYIHGFLQPEQLPEVYKNARIFCLPSLEEHWGLVVHEAALCGCVLLLGRDVGAVQDFLMAGVNGFAFNPRRLSDMVAAFAKAMAMSEAQLENAQRESVRLAGQITINGFVNGIRSLIEFDEES